MKLALKKEREAGLAMHDKKQMEVHTKNIYKGVRVCSMRAVKKKSGRLCAKGGN